MFQKISFSGRVQSSYSHKILKNLYLKHKLTTHYQYTLQCVCMCVCVLVTQSCLALCDPMDCSPPCSSVHGTSQARILKQVAIPFCRGSSTSWDKTWVSCIIGRLFTIWATNIDYQPTISIHCSIILLKAWVNHAKFTALIMLPFYHEKTQICTFQHSSQ